MKILLVDDEPVHLRLMEATIRHWGYEVTTATDGQAAWEILQRDGAPSLVVTDWAMPGLDGFELTRRIRDDDALASTPVLIVTVRAATVTSDSRPDQANEYLVKPWNPRELRSAITRLTEAA